MTRNIYVLLVGIDDYKDPVPPLKGCVNDILTIKEYLEGRVSADGNQLHTHTLLNEQATRHAIIDGFQQHLCKAGSEDVAFFYFAGHGSQEASPEEFWVLEPDRLDETIVCYDSRRKDASGKEVWDLADKELAKLIAEVAAKNPHISVIMDCCHSGSGTRGDLEGEASPRLAPIDRRKRPLDSFIFSLSEVDSLVESRSAQKNPSGWTFPKGNHVFFAACQSSELAKEYNVNGQRRGAFSYFLVDTLQKANGTLSYRDLFKRANALVRSKVSAQSPQIEATNLGDLDLPFLGGAIAQRQPYFTASNHPQYGWVIDGGAIHGVPKPEGDETTLLALFPNTTPPEGLRELKAKIGEARVVEVLPQLSKIEIESSSTFDPEMTYKAVVTSLPLPPKGVIIAGDEAGVEFARKALNTANDGKPSLFVREVTTTDKAEFKLLARDSKYLITRPADDRPLVGSIEGYNQITAFQAIQRLEHIARWLNIVELASTSTSAILPNAVEIEIYQNDKLLEQDTQIHLEYRQINGKWTQPSFKIKLKNKSNQRLYCALLDLTERYAVTAALIDGGGLWLEPSGEIGSEAWANRGTPIYPSVPKELWEQGITEVKDVLKLIVSTTEFDATLMEQGALDAPQTGKRTIPRRGKGTLNRLMNRIPSRDLGLKPEEDEIYDDWVTNQVYITTVRPKEVNQIPSGDRSADLGVGVKIYGHPSLKASARLTTVNSSTRDLGSHLIPPLLRPGRAGAGVEPLMFTNSRGADPGLNVLELTQVENREVVTSDSPLKIVVDVPLKANEQVLPYSFDGEFFLPLGRGQGTADGKTEILLERLAEPVSQGSRTISGSIKIFFQKVLSENLGWEFNYPQLAVAEVPPHEVANYPNEKVTYITELNTVKERVAKAERIVLFIHGIFGNTRNIVPCIRRAKMRIEGQEKSLADLYDVALTFDYENLNTSLEENARKLKQKLEEVGLGKNHGKTLHVIAHSMGGLVSRWFIEHEGGNQIVQHLFMLGTPNDGSPWSTVQEWALTILTLGLNGLSEVTWPIPVIGMLMKAVGKVADGIEAIDVTLDQIKPKSDFLQNLAGSNDPGISYTIIAGNTSLITTAHKQKAMAKLDVIKRLQQKLFNKVVEMPFFGQPNDIAATVGSIKNISLERKPQPQTHEVACDSLVYFSDPAALSLLSKVVMQALGKTGESISTPNPATVTRSFRSL